MIDKLFKRLFHIHTWDYQIANDENGEWKVMFKYCDGCGADKFVKVLKRPPAKTVTMRTEVLHG